MLKGAGAKAKGANGERELAALLTTWAAAAGHRVGLVRNLEQTRGGGHDLLGLEELLGLAVEVKRVESPAVSQWWKQACRQANTVACRPVLAHRANRKPWQFRVRVWVYPAPEPIDVDMTAEVFRAWFVACLNNSSCAPE